MPLNRKELSRRVVHRLLGQGRGKQASTDYLEYLEVSPFLNAAEDNQLITVLAAAIAAEIENQLDTSDTASVRITYDDGNLDWNAKVRELMADSDLEKIRRYVERTTGRKAYREHLEKDSPYSADFVDVFVLDEWPNAEASLHLAHKVWLQSITPKRPLRNIERTYGALVKKMAIGMLSEMGIDVALAGGKGINIEGWPEVAITFEETQGSEEAFVRVNNTEILRGDPRAIPKSLYQRPNAQAKSYYATKGSLEPPPYSTIMSWSDLETYLGWLRASLDHPSSLLQEEAEFVIEKRMFRDHLNRSLKKWSNQESHIKAVSRGFLKRWHKKFQNNPIKAQEALRNGELERFFGKDTQKLFERAWNKTNLPKMFGSLKLRQETLRAFFDRFEEKLASYYEPEQGIPDLRFFNAIVTLVLLDSAMAKFHPLPRKKIQLLIMSF